MKIAICDDDLVLNRKLHQFIFETYHDIDLRIDEYCSGEEFLQKISTSKLTYDSIMPVLTIISGGTLIWYMKWEISVRTVLPFVLLFVLFTITWLSERATLKKSRSKEDIHGISD